MGEYAKYGFDQQGWYGMFVACGIRCLADVSSVSPSSEQTQCSTLASLTKFNPCQVSPNLTLAGHTNQYSTLATLTKFNPCQASVTKFRPHNIQLSSGLELYLLVSSQRSDQLANSRLAHTQDTSCLCTFADRNAPVQAKQFSLSPDPVVLRKGANIKYSGRFQVSGDACRHKVQDQHKS